MILQELYRLYARLDERGAYVPRKGQSMQKISFRIVIRLDGSLVGIWDARVAKIREKKGKKGRQKDDFIAEDLLVLGNTKSSGIGVDPCFLWDNPAYLLGYTEKKAKDKDRALECFGELRRKHCAVESAIGSARFSAVCRFLESWDPARCAEEIPNKACLKGNGVFRILGDEFDVHEDPDVVRWWDKQGSGMWRGGEKKQDSTQVGMCLVTGKSGPIACLHEPAIRGVDGATEPRLVSFNHEAFESYGKKQSLNASVSEKAAFAYCNALNYLLSHERTCVRMPGTTVVFWTDSPPENEEEDENFARYALDPYRVSTMDEALAKDIHDRMVKIARGWKLGDTQQREDATRFFILGLSPNKGRLSVRFFHESTLGNFIRNLAAHYDALRIQKRGEKFHDPDIISPLMIIKEIDPNVGANSYSSGDSQTEPQASKDGSSRKDDNKFSHSLVGALMRSILLGLPYPDAIAMAILRRMRSMEEGRNEKGEKKKKHQVNYIRCAFLKAWLTRKKTLFNPPIMLDTQNTQPGYILGRLFAILQKTQKEALGDKIDRTIQDAYYGSASVTPQSVFPRILRMSHHHLAVLRKEKKGLWCILKNLLQEVMSLLTTFPAHLNPEQQGLFALGFYHQTQDFYTSKENQN